MMWLSANVIIVQNLDAGVLNLPTKGN